MLNQRKDFFTAILLFCAALALLSLLVPEWIFTPNSSLMANYGDGLKNMFSFSWFLSHESSGVYVSGVNYPFGEHLVYLDGQPGLALLLRPFGLGNYAVGIAQLALAFSFVMGAVFLFGVARELGMRRTAAFLAGLTLILITPQLDKLGSSTTLGYISCLPGTWFLLLLTVRKEKTWLGVLFLLIHNLFWTLIHPYLGLMSGMFCGGFWLLWMFRQGLSLNFKPQWLLYGGLITFFHLACFRGWIGLTDIHTGRPSIPSGFLLQITTLVSLLTSGFGPISGFFNYKFELWEYLNLEVGEGAAYVGAGQILFGVAGIAGAVVTGIRKRTIGWLKDDQKMLMGISLFVALGMLLFAMGYPFKWDPIWMERLSFLKQFRSLGRFNWMFFYVFGIFAWLWIDRMAEFLEDRVGRWLGLTLLVVMDGLNLMEGYYHFEVLKITIFQHSNPFTEAHVDDEPWGLGGALAAIQPDAYQSMLPVPFWYNGTESLILPQLFSVSRQNGMILSWHTGIPMHAMDGARAPVYQAKQQCQLFAPLQYRKELASHILDPRPILLVQSKNVETCREEDELLQRATVFYEDDRVKLLRIERDELFAHHPVPPTVNGLQESLGEYVHYEGFEDHPCEYSYRGKGALADWIGRFIILFDSEQDSVSLEPGRTYEFSFWFRHVEEGVYRHTVNLEQYNEAGEFIVYDIRDEGKNARIFDGEWVQMVYSFKVHEEAKGLRWVLHGDEETDLMVYVDGVMIR